MKMNTQNKEEISDIAGLIDSYWKFDNNQQPQSSWHEKQALLEKVRNIIDKEQNKALSESQVKMVVQWLKRHSAGTLTILFKDEFCKIKKEPKPDSPTIEPIPSSKEDILNSILSQITPLDQEKARNRLRVAAVLDELISVHGKDAFTKKIGKRPSEISKWLSGTQNFTVDTLSLITHHLGISLSDFMEKVYNHGTK